MVATRRRGHRAVGRSLGPLRFEGPDGKLYGWRSPRTRDELAWYFRTFFGWTLAPTPHPDCVDRGHWAPLDVAWLAYTGRHPRTGERESIAVLKGSRGLAGKSTLLAGVSTLEGLGGLDGVLLGGSLEQSRRVAEAADEIYDRDVVLEGTTYETPFRYLIPDPTVRETRFASGATRKVLTASRRSARGQHPERARLDEIDEMTQDVFDSAMGQTMTEDDERRPTQTLLSSTHQHAKGTMTTVLERAVEREWPVMEVCYRESLRENGGWLTWTQVETKKHEVSSEMWETEYELGEPSLEGRVFREEDVAALWDRRYGRFQGDAGEVLQFACCSRTLSPVAGTVLRAHDAAPCPEHRYAVGVDWAARRDWTVVTVYRTDVTPWWLVHFERMKRRSDPDGPRWPERIARVGEVLRLYRANRRTAAHDATGMGGDMAADLLEVVERIDAEPVVLSGSRRDNLLEAYVVAVEQHDLTGPRVEWAYGSHKYLTKDALWTGGGQHTPDDVIAGALARHAQGRGPMTTWAPSDFTKTPLVAGVTDDYADEDDGYDW